MNKLQFRPASHHDAGMLLAWRNDEATRVASRQTDMVAPQQHAAWLARKLADPACQLLIAECQGEPVGTIRVDDDELPEISWTVAPHARGKGYGAKMVQLALALHNVPTQAVVRSSNVASQKIADRCGFQLVRSDGEWLTYRWEPPT